MPGIGNLLSRSTDEVLDHETIVSHESTTRRQRISAVVRRAIAGSNVPFEKNADGLSYRSHFTASQIRTMRANVAEQASKDNGDFDA